MTNITLKTSDMETSRLCCHDLSVGYGSKIIIEGLDLAVKTGSVTALVGPNGSGKSTLLAAMARLLPAYRGSVVLDGKSIHATPTKEVAKRLGILPQAPIAPEGITVAELVQRGRRPHQGWGGRTQKDDEIVARALVRTNVAQFASRTVDSLSGGQRQRVWIAMALAQETPLLLLDEPTSYLDIAHQVEILDLLLDLNDDGTTVAMVVHDLNQAARYADTIVAMKDGHIVTHGPPKDVVDAHFVEEVFGMHARVIFDPDTASPLVLPRGRHDIHQRSSRTKHNDP